MQALILAAGMGKRLGVYTEKNTKGMIDIDGTTLIERAIHFLADLGIKRIGIVVGYRSEGIISKVSGIKGIEPEFIFNEDYESTNNIYSLYLARGFLGNDDTILLESDIIFDRSVMERLVAQDGDVAVVDRYEYWMDGTAVSMDKNGNIAEFIDKANMNADMAERYYKTVNIYRFSKKFSNNHYIPRMEEYIEGKGRNSYYEAVLKVLADDPESQMKALCINDHEKWYEIDDPKDLHIAEILFSERPLGPMTNSYGGFWRFPQVLDYCYLVNPFFPPEMLLYDIMSMAPKLISQYPSGMGVQSLNAGVLFDVDPESILVGNGAAELINHLAPFIGGKLAVCTPAFNEYLRCFSSSEIMEIDTSLDGYRFNEARLMDALASADTLVIVSPDNPSGAHLEKDAVIRLLDRAKELERKVIFDESFIDFADDPYTLLDRKVLKDYPNLIVIKSISKSYGVPGLRLGVMGSSDKELMGRVRNSLSVWNINSFGEMFMQTATKYRSHYISGCENYRKERSRFRHGLSKIPWLSVYDSQANYFMCRITAEISSRELAETLLRDHGILIKDLSGKVGVHDDRHIRLAVRCPDDNDRLISSLKDILPGRVQKRRM